MVSLDDAENPEGCEHGIGTPTDGYRTQHDWEGNSSISTSVVKAVSAVTGDAPATIDPLYEVVDPDALDGVLASLRGGEEATVTFAFHECVVIIDGVGQIAIQPTDADGC